MIHLDRACHRIPVMTVSPESSHSPRPLRGRDVLVVDDDADARAFLEAVFSLSGADVRTASSVTAALAEVDRRVPDVIVSDIGMPERDGFDLIAAIRRRAPARGGAVPAVALTAFARWQDRWNALASGFQVHVAKPVDAREILAVVVSLLPPRSQ